MPSTPLSLFALLLAFSAQLPLAAASPVTWYAAPTVTSSTSVIATSTPTRTVWYNADPTTSKKPSSSSSPSAFFTVWYKAPVSSAAPPPAAPASITLPSFSGQLKANGRLWCPITPGSSSCKSPTTMTPLDVPSMSWRYHESEVCPNSTLPAGYLALDEFSFAYQGASLSSGFYEKHGGLSRFCGHQIKVTNPLNSSQSFTYTVTRGLASVDEAVGLAGAATKPQAFFRPYPRYQDGELPVFEFEFV
ncbi:hypothetical protein JCM11251_007436 [Rhodosporidiobolus azoricus]